MRLGATVSSRAKFALGKQLELHIGGGGGFVIASDRVGKYEA